MTALGTSLIIFLLEFFVKFQSPVLKLQARHGYAGRRAWPVGSGKDGV